MLTYSPKAGYAYNPLIRYRNVPCPCKSGKKVKKCCGQYRYVKKEFASKINKWLKTMGLKTMETIATKEFLKD